MNAEQDRFVKYQASYRDTPPVNAAKGASTPTAKANGTMQTRTTKYGEGKMTPEARAKAQSQGK